MSQVNKQKQPCQFQRFRRIPEKDRCFSILEKVKKKKRFIMITASSSQFSSSFRSPYFAYQHQWQPDVKLIKNKQNKTKQNKTKQNKTKQNKTKQSKTKQNKTKHNKTNNQIITLSNLLFWSLISLFMSVAMADMFASAPFSSSKS